MQRPAQRFLAEDDDVVQAFSANGSDEMFDEWVLPGRPRCNEDFANVHSLELSLEFVSVDPIAIAKKIPRGGIKRESLDDLLCGPHRSGMGGDIETKDASTIVSQDDENIQYAERNRGHGKEIDRNQL